VIIVRYADDFVVRFEYESDARRFWDALRARLEEFALALHPDKTRLIEFGRHAADRRARAGLGKPETFKFLGFGVLPRRKEATWIKEVSYSCVRDEGRPLGIGFQERVPNHSKRRRLKAVVVSVGAKA
jgi:hypothetical protein